MKPTFLTIIFLFFFLSVQSQITPILTIRPSGDSIQCNGWVNFSNSSQYISWDWIDTDSSTVLSSNNTFIDSLCEGKYFLFFTDTSGTYSETIIIDFSYCDNVLAVQPATSDSWEQIGAYCTGTADIEVTLNGFNLGPVTKIWMDELGNVIDTVRIINSLCPGKYIYEVTEFTSSCIQTDTVEVFDLGANPYFTIFLDIYDASVGICDGMVNVNIVGGTPPYQYNHVSDTTNFTPLSNNLCPGINYVWIVDNIGDVGISSFLIAELNDLIVNSTYPDSLVTDTLHGNPIEDCTIDFSNIYSATINSTYQVGDSILVDWLITYNNTTSIIISQYYITNPPNIGIYAFTLSLYCTQKALSNVVKVYDQFNLAYLSTNEVKEEMEVLIYPNPTKEIVNINLNEKGSLTIYNIKGQTILKRDLLEQNKVDVSFFEKGMYFLLITTNKGSVVRKIIKE